MTSTGLHTPCTHLPPSIKEKPWFSPLINLHIVSRRAPWCHRPGRDAPDLVRRLGGVTAAAERDAEPRRRQVHVQLRRRRQRDGAVLKPEVPEVNV